MKINTQNSTFLFTLSFIEGASVMSAELIGAKMLAPYFGSSLFVWATVMAVTLGGLALGYFTGGFFAEKNKNNNFLFFIVLSASIFTALMPISSKLILMLTVNLPLLTSIIITTILFLMPPVFLMGMVSPLIIERLSNNNNHAGKTSGNIYAISTLGGIIATFGMGFYIIPHFGLSKPAYFTGIFLALLPIIAIFKDKKKAIPLLLFFVFFGRFIFIQNSVPSDIKILYQKEGILGQIMVVDYPVYQTSNIPDYHIRMMLFNRVIQTIFNKNDATNQYFPYVHLLIKESVHQMNGGKALLLGLGGGCVANELLYNNFEVDAVELDERVRTAARDYFDLSQKVNVHIDDARRFINNTKKKYDLIIFDVFKGEENPAHIITKESLEIVKSKLNTSGMIVINGYGYRTGNKSKGTKAIVKTLQQAGFYTNILPSSKKEDEGNLLIFAKQFNFKTQNKVFTFSTIDIQQAPVLSDDQPILELLNIEAVAAWRGAYIATAIKDFNQRNVPLFN
jgi:spermidine synthase